MQIRNNNHACVSRELSVEEDTKENSSSANILHQTGPSGFKKFY